MGDAVENGSSLQLPPPSSHSATASPQGGGGEEKKGFVKVLCRDGSTELDWPAEMVRQTRTAQPSIPYSVNPLFFNFGHLVGGGAGGREAEATVDVKDETIKVKLEHYEIKISAEDAGDIKEAEDGVEDKTKTEKRKTDRKRKR